jgi:FkbM family methyltransferase
MCQRRASINERQWVLGDGQIVPSYPTGQAVGATLVGRPLSVLAPIKKLLDSGGCAFREMSSVCGWRQSANSSTEPPLCLAARQSIPWSRNFARRVPDTQQRLAHIVGSRLLLRQSGLGSIGMMKTLHLCGYEMPVMATDDDYYLESMPPGGPSELMPIFEEFCVPGCNVIDVGANIGVTAMIAGLLLRSGIVLAVEPVIEAFQLLKENTRRPELSNVRSFNVAAAAEEGQVNLITRSGHNFAAFVGYENVLDRYSGYSESAVRAMTLDQLVANEALTRVDFIKIDVEGYEIEVLHGSRAILERFKPVVFLEANHYCLNVFRRISIVDFVEEVLSIFPVVFAVDTTLEMFDLTDQSTHAVFFHDNVVRGLFPNLLCGFTDEVRQSADRLRSIERAARGGGSTDHGPPTSSSAPSVSSSESMNRRIIAGVKRRLSRP